jgi:hypothetical protein
MFSIFNSPTATTASPRMWASCIITASEAQYFIMMPRFPVSSAFLAPRLPELFYAVLRKPRSRSTRRGSGVAPEIRFIPFAVTEFGTLGGHATAFLRSWLDKQSHLKGCMWASCWPHGADGFSHRPCRSRGQRLALNVRRRGRCGGRLLFVRDAVSCHGALNARHGPQASPCFLELRVRSRLPPPCVEISALPSSILSLMC